MSSVNEHSTLGELSESEVLSAILPRLPRGQHTLLGPGDDAAVLAVPGGHVAVTTDTLIEGPDFRRAWSAPFDIGWKAAAVNLADVAAMGAEPSGLVVAIAAPPETLLDDLLGLADGLAAACAALAPEVGVVGGDLASAPVLTVAVTAFGHFDGRAPVTRSGAQAGDVLAYCGRRGQAARAIALLFAEGCDDDGQPDARRAQALKLAHPALIAAQLRPEPPLAAGPAAAKAGAHAMLDVSDGLSQDAGRLAVASGVGIRFDPATFSAEADFELYGGEDHGLLAAFPPETKLPDGFELIGSVTDESGVVRFGEERVEARGWEALADWKARPFGEQGGGRSVS